MTTALVIIDVQTSLVASPVHEPERLLANLRQLIDQATAAHVPVVYVQDDDVEAGPGTPGWQVHPAITPRASDPCVTKKACDSFHETRLDEVLRGLGADHLVIAGCKTEFCIDTSVRRAISLGYGVTLASDAHSTTDGALTAAQTIAHHNHLFNGFGALVGGKVCEVRVMPTESVRF
jgi:nicotinamidase-related amidase